MKIYDLLQIEASKIVDHITELKSNEDTQHNRAIIQFATSKLCDIKNQLHEIYLQETGQTKEVGVISKHDRVEMTIDGITSQFLVTEIGYQEFKMVNIKGTGSPKNIDIIVFKTQSPNENNS